MESRELWEVVGEIRVDGGQVYIGDPCYFNYKKEFEQIKKTSENLIYTGESHSNVNYQSGHMGLGFIIDTGAGDGYFPIYKNKFSNEYKITLWDFLEDNENDEDES